MIRRGNAMLGISEIGRLKETIRRLSDLPRQTAIEAKPEIDKELQAEFQRGVDPYGNPWAPLAPSTLARGRTPPPLTDSRQLRDGTSTELRLGHRAGLLIKTGAPYGYFHQVGFRVGRTRVPPRRILPQFGLPKAWRNILRRATERAAQRLVRR